MAITPSRIGQINGAGSGQALFLEVFSGLVLNSFNKNQITMERQVVRHIKDGASAQFPAIGRATGGYFTPGDELVGRVINHAKITIAIEEVLLSDVFVAEIDEFHNHYPVRKEYADQLGEYLANAHDSNSFRCIWAGANASATITGGDTGQTLTGDLGGDIDLFKAAIYDVAQSFDENKVPQGGRHLAVAPNDWYRLLADGEFINRDYAGEGSKARATLPWAANIQLHMTTNLPTADESGGVADVPDSLEFDFTDGGTGSGYLGAAWHESGIATVKLMDLKTEMDYLIQYQGTLIVSKYAMGQGYIRPESCHTLSDNA